MEVKMFFKKVKLFGNPPQVGETLPEFTVENAAGDKINTKDLLGKPMVLCSVPNLDSEVCSLETKKFNKKADEFTNVRFVTISNNDLEVQKNWCAAKGVDNLEVMSDFDGSFGEAMKLYIPEIKHLARAVFLINADGKIVYEQIVPQVARQPKYKEVIEKIKELFE
ncbi:2-Cys peroxiredoxin [Fructilactobacillus lindneri]|uniref:Thiol peroxidase n=2 Tax=Fructilactobacillus lindneri TaxID=53444 RepID=A0A0R2JPY1_9LACO|nr:peroxiredoxin [Fructilactobacillus lindneri]ANZ58351.1 2-Cys peroxiredoxin [Fructilactobacillus lindneri]ANZ59673.1 2-Cys peroxiredoxin [Fructilactobacillus lindneri]KRN79186.1 thiol peroxidase [Fructilactobacillus lindneri DSM 20690 = JCM 11027]POG98544.1 2-Cys peroxiredoxin [Fructilactobacillus lindneri]POH03932.1 2-Cys peroxiredoxin [Fructilactobacillus lindneri]